MDILQPPILPPPLPPAEAPTPHRNSNRSANEAVLPFPLIMCVILLVVCLVTFIPFGTSSNDPFRTSSNDPFRTSSNHPFNKIVDRSINTFDIENDPLSGNAPSLGNAWSIMPNQTSPCRHSFYEGLYHPKPMLYHLFKYITFVVVVMTHHKSTLSLTFLQHLHASTLARMFIHTRSYVHPHSLVC